MTQQLFIIQLSENLPRGIREMLVKKGFASTITESVESFTAAVNEAAIKGTRKDFITLLCCEDPKDQKASIDALVEHKLSLQNPLLLIGRDAEQLESRLIKHFILATALPTPSALGDILRSIAHLTKYTERIRQQKQPVETDEKEPTKTFYEEFRAIPETIISQFDTLGLFNKDLGGARYATIFHPHKSEDQFFLPKIPERSAFVADFSRSLNEQQISRFSRIQLLSSLILSALNLPEDILEDGLTAAGIYSYGFFQSAKITAHGEYLSHHKIPLRKEICSLIKDTIIARREIEQFGETAAIVKKISKIIGEEESTDNDPISLAASAIATADVVDRIVYNHNAFQPIAAYCLLSKLKREKVAFMHPLVLAVLIKILSEGATSNASGLAITKKMKNVARLTHAASEIEELILKQEHIAVRIRELVPGMRVSNPVITYDGRAVLDETVVLDQDLILRLWQLSTVRPLQEYVAVEKE
jgi:hypothetical protein